MVRIIGTLVQAPNHVQALSFGLAATSAIVAVTVLVEVAIRVLAVRQARDSRSHAVANTTSATHRAIAHPAGKHHTRASQHGYYDYHSHPYLVAGIRIRSYFADASEFDRASEAAKGAITRYATVMRLCATALRS